MPQRTFTQHTQSTGLVASPTTADLSTATGEFSTATATTAKQKLSVAQILRVGATAYVNQYRDGQACLRVQGVLAKLSLCRTQALGGRWYECEDCHAECGVYNSCGDRHCPQCSGSKRYDFSERASRLLLHGIDYYQVVFTLPGELSRLALSNREAIADLLFRSAWKSLRKTIHGEQGYEPAAIMVLHTWNQHLDAHWHVHALVPGAGPGLAGSGWQVSTAPVGSGNSDGHYLVDAIALRESYRKTAIADLNRLRDSGELKLEVAGEFGNLQDDAVWQVFIEKLSAVDWVSFIQPPPGNSTGPHDLVRYLTRYLTGGPISDARIVHADEREVTFMARAGKTAGGDDKQVPVTLPLGEFVQKWCLHIQPEQLTKTRYFGGWSNSKLSAYQDRCVRELEAAGVALSADADEFPPAELCTEGSEHQGTGDDAGPICPNCSSRSLVLLESWPQPSWRELFRRGSESCPAWYGQSLEQDERAFWDAAMGAGFSDWHDEYLETLVESAKAARRRPPLQPLLPGICFSELLALEFS